MTAPTNVVTHRNGDTIHQYYLNEDTRVSVPVTPPTAATADVFWVRQDIAGNAYYVGFDREAAVNLVAALRAEGLV